VNQNSKLYRMRISTTNHQHPRWK